MIRKDETDMKKYFGRYAVIWVIFFAFFNLTAFIIPSPPGTIKYTSSFWIGYVFVTVSLLGQLFLSYIIFSKGETSKKLFLQIPVYKVGHACLVVSCIIGALCMIISGLKYWIAAVVCAAILAFYAILAIRTITGADIIEETEDKVKTGISRMKTLTAEAKTIADLATDSSSKAACMKVYESFRYSDPVSVPALEDDETILKGKLVELKRLINDGNDVEDKTGELIRLIAARNEKCRLYK